MKTTEDTIEQPAKIERTQFPTWTLNDKGYWHRPLRNGENGRGYALNNGHRTVIHSHCSSTATWDNHPSGDPTPSEADIKVTRDMIRAGQLLRIDVVDHVIVGDFLLPDRSRQYSSLRELGYFYQ